MAETKAATRPSPSAHLLPTTKGTAAADESAASNDAPTSPPPPMKDWPVLVDELDYTTASITINKPGGGGGTNLPPSSPTGGPPPMVKGSHNNDDRVKNVIGPLDFSGGGAKACPCCARYVVPSSSGGPCSSPCSTATLIQEKPDNQHQSKSQSHPPEAGPDDDHHLPGSLNPTDSSSYTITTTLVQGWVHKKGTGLGIFGSRAWKPRWASLVLATVPGYEVSVPLLLIYWFSSSENPSNVIVLDGTVVVPVDRYKTKEKVVVWNTYTFEIIHTSRDNHHHNHNHHHNGSPSAPPTDNAPEDGKSKIDRITRTFSVPEQERSDWVLAINTALLDYEKRLNKARMEAAAASRVREGVRETGARSPPLVSPPVLGGGGQLHHVASMGGGGTMRPLSPTNARSAGGVSGGPTSPPTGGPTSNLIDNPPLSPRSGVGVSGGMPPLSPRSAGGMPPLSPRSGGGGIGIGMPPLSPRSGAGKHHYGTNTSRPVSPPPPHPPTVGLGGMKIDMPHL